MKRLFKKSGKDFKILNLSDPQLDKNDWKEDAVGQKMLRYTVDELIKRVQPDLITISGDISYGTQYESYRAFGDMLDAYGIPWAPVWGNHDDQAGPEAVQQVVDEYLKRPLCVYESGDPVLGNGNYVIAIEDEATGKTVEGLIMMDSHDRVPYTKPDGTTMEAWAKLIPEQLDWYAERIAELDANGCHDTTLIMHIPHFGYHTAWDAARGGGCDPESMKFADSFDPAHWNEGYRDSFGLRREPICSYVEDEGALEVFERLGSTHHVVAGHDHINNFVINYHGIKHVYATKTGRGCYFNADLSGGTVLTVGDDGIKDVRQELVDVSAFL